MVLKDCDIRDDLCLYLENHYGQVRFFDELTMGKSRADIVMVTREAIFGIEIKSDADTYARLPRQIKDYDRYFDYNYVVVGSRHAHHIREHIPEYWGVLSAEYMVPGEREVDFYPIKTPDLSPKAKLKTQLSLLWRREIAHIQKINGLYKYSGKSRGFVEKYLMESVPEETLKQQMIEVLFERDYSIFDEK